MKFWHFLCFACLTVLSVFLLAAGWEFWLEEIVESRLGIEEVAETVRDHWEYVFTSTYFAALALIVPVLMALKIGPQRQKAQDEIAHTAHILKTTFDNMSRGIAVRDADLNLIAFNQQYVDLLDYPPDFIRLGMPFEEIASFKAARGDYGNGEPEELARERVALRSLMKPDRNETITARGLILSKRREPLPGGGYVTTFTDITERKRANAELAEKSRVLETTFESMSQGIAVYDAKLCLVAFNEKFCDFRGYPPGFIRLGMPFEDMVRYQAEREDYGPGDTEEQVRKRVDALRQGKPWYGEHHNSDGRVIAIHRDPLPGGGCVNTFTDITKRKRAEEAVRESEGRLAGILDIADEAVISIDQAHRIILFNKGAERTFGYEAGEVLGEPLEMLLPAEFKDEHRHHVENFAEGSKAARLMGERREIFGRRKDGTEFPCEASISKLDLNGKRVFTVILRDVTTLKAAEREIAEKSALLESTFESMSRGIRVLDNDDNLVAFNRRFVELWDFPPGFIRLGMPAEKIVRFKAERGDYGPGDAEEHVKRRLAERRQRRVYQRETKLPWGAVIVANHEPMPAGYVGTYTDITERKQAEATLREREANLKEHVIELEAAKRQYEAQGVQLASLVEDLAMAREQAEGANRAKSDFLAVMSHELRTPLNAIIGFSEIIKSEIMGPIGNPKYGEYASDVFDSAQHLLGLINDILDLSKIEAGKMELEEEDVDVAEVIGACLRLVTERAMKGGVELITKVPDDLPALRFDERKLKQILVNLLSNAVKFTTDGGTVTIRSWFRPEDGFVLQVADTGIGIAPESIERALTPFGQVDSRLDRKYEGTGLGLPLTKSLVEKHGGSLDLQSEVGVGTTVTVRLPKERAVAMPADAPSAPRSLSKA